MEFEKTKNIVEGALLASGKPMSVNQLDDVFSVDGQADERPTRDDIRKALKSLEEDYSDRAMELKQVGSGFRIQIRQDFEPWIRRLWQEKPPRYSRALLETLAIIAYRQPITRSEIEEIRGVSVSSNITRTLQEREWVKVVGHRDVPGKPALFGTTRAFLDYFNLKHLDELPTLAELKDLDSLYPELDLEDKAVSDDNRPSGPAAADGDEPQTADAEPAAADTDDAGPGEGERPDQEEPEEAAPVDGDRPTTLH